MIGVMEARKGIRLQGLVANITVPANAGGLPLFQVSNAANRIGVATVVLKRVKIYNHPGTGDGVLHIGTGVAGAIVDVMPALVHLDGLNADFVELDLPEVQFAVDIMGWSDVQPIDVQVEVEEVS